MWQRPMLPVTPTSPPNPILPPIPLPFSYSLPVIKMNISLAHAESPTGRDTLTGGHPHTLSGMDTHIFASCICMCTHVFTHKCTLAFPLPCPRLRGRALTSRQWVLPGGIGNVFFLLTSFKHKVPLLTVRPVFECAFCFPSVKTEPM